MCVGFLFFIIFMHATYSWTVSWSYRAFSNWWKVSVLFMGCVQLFCLSFGKVQKYSWSPAKWIILKIFPSSIVESNCVFSFWLFFHVKFRHFLIWKSSDFGTYILFFFFFLFLPSGSRYLLLIYGRLFGRWRLFFLWLIYRYGSANVWKLSQTPLTTSH